VHYCEATKKFSSRNYFDETDLRGIPTTSNAMPIKDESGNPLTTEIGLCNFVDNQRVTLQELPESAPPGQLPRSTGTSHAGTALTRLPLLSQAIAHTISQATFSGCASLVENLTELGSIAVVGFPHCRGLFFKR
jgi:hypothetical protein